MKEVPTGKKIGPRAKALIVIFGLFFLGLLLGLMFAQVGISEARTILSDLGVDVTALQARQISNVYSFVIVIIVIDIVLLAGLLYIYFDAYRETKSSFMLGLTLFISVLFVRSLLTLFTMHVLITKYLRAFPVIRELIGDSGFGSLGFLVTIFEIVAISILLYISME